MRHCVFLCDKCGAVVENFSHITIKIDNNSMVHEISLCHNCFKEFCELTDKFMEAKRKCREYNEYQLAKHILGEEK